jgi:hypothetical protein
MLTECTQSKAISRGPIPYQLPGQHDSIQAQMASDMFNTYHPSFCSTSARSTSPQKTAISTPPKACFWLGEYCVGDVDCPSLYGDPSIIY